MSDTENQVEIPAPDANATTAEPEVSAAESSPAVNDADEITRAAKGVGKRIDELTRNWREAERREAALLEMLKTREQPKADPVPVQSEAIKTLADFEFDDAKYQAYIFETAQKRSVEAARRELEAERERRTKAQRDASFQVRSQEFAKTAEDYEDVTIRNVRLPITDAMAEVIKESEEGPALFYHLGKNPDVAAKIAQLPPIVAARELGKIEAKLAFEREKAKEKPVSKAPQPAPKIEGGNPAFTIKPDSADSDALSDEDWTRLRNKQVSRRR